MMRSRVFFAQKGQVHGGWERASRTQRSGVVRNVCRPEAIGRTGEGLVRIYMERVAPKIWPAALHQPLHGVIGAVRIRTELDLIDVDGTLIDIRISQRARIDPMHRFELATCARLAPGASGVVRSDILVARKTPQHLERTWEVTEADIRWTDSLYQLAQHAMQRGYYMPNRNSRHCSRHHCPYWRRCEQDFGGVVEA